MVEPSIRQYSLSQGEWGVGFDVKLDLACTVAGAKSLYWRLERLSTFALGAPGKFWHVPRRAEFSDFQKRWVDGSALPGGLI